MRRIHVSTGKRIYKRLIHHEDQKVTKNQFRLHLDLLIFVAKTGDEARPAE
jgi:hypothetical protein